ncbi:HAD family hydrolase [Comamonas humi]
MLDISRIRAISFDLDDTLWPVLPTLARAEAAQHAFLQQHAPATAAWLQDPDNARRLRERLRVDLAHRLHDMTHFRQQFIARALEQTGGDAALMPPAFEAFHAGRNQVDMFDEVHDCLAWLQARYPLVAISNGNARLDRVGLDGYFSAGISAHLAGMAKPDARIFEMAAQQLELPLSAFLHVGDDAALDVEGALAAGMQAAWVQRRELDYHRQPAEGAAPPWHLPSPAPQAVVATLHDLCALLGRDF